MKKKYIIGAICLIVVIALAYQYNEDQKKYEAYMKECAAYNEKIWLTSKTLCLTEYH